jgi:hypothetical protein
LGTCAVAGLLVATGVGIGMHSLQALLRHVADRAGALTDVAASTAEAMAETAEVAAALAANGSWGVEMGGVALGACLTSLVWE